MPATIEDTYKMFGVDQPTTASPEAQSLVSTPAEINLAAQPTLEKLEAMINQINRQGQMSMIPGGEQMEQQSAQNIANLLAGKVDTDWMQNMQAGLAQQYGARGFGPDTGAMSAAAMRAMGLQSQALKSQGEKELAAAYARFPSYDISKSMLDPTLYTTYLNQKAQQAAEAARLAEQRREFDASLAFKQSQAGSASANELTIAQMQADATQKALNEKIREFNVTHDTDVLQQVNTLREQARQANMDVSLKTQQLNAQVWGTALQYMDPMFASATAVLQHQLPQYVQTNIPNVNIRTPQLIGGWGIV